MRCRGRGWPCRSRGSRHGSRTGGGCAGSSGSNANCSTIIPGRPSSSRSRADGRSDHAEVLGDERKRSRRARARAPSRRTPRDRARAASGRRARCASRPAPPSTPRNHGSGRSGRGRTARASVAAVRSTSGSGARRSAGQSYSGLPHSCPLAANASGGAPATRPVWNSSGWSDVVGAAGRRRRSAGRRTGALRDRARTGEARPTRARTGPGRPTALAAGEPLPIADPERVALAEIEQFRRAHRKPGDRAAGPPRGERGARLVRRAVTGRAAPSGSVCHHDCPAAASQSTNRYASGPRRPPGSEVM